MSMKFDEFARTKAAAAIRPITVGRNPQKAYPTYLLDLNLTKKMQIIVININEGRTTAEVATIEPHTEEVAA